MKPLPNKFAIVNKKTGNGVVFKKRTPTPIRRVRPSRVAVAKKMKA